MFAQVLCSVAVAVVVAPSATMTGWRQSMRSTETVTRQACVDAQMQHIDEIHVGGCGWSIR
jgi:hypothetical protein